MNTTIDRFIKEARGWLKDYSEMTGEDYGDEETMEGAAYLLLSQAIRLLRVEDKGEGKRTREDGVECVIERIARLTGYGTTPDSEPLLVGQIATHGRDAAGRPYTYDYTRDAVAARVDAPMLASESRNTCECTMTEDDSTCASVDDVRLVRLTEDYERELCWWCVACRLQHADMIERLVG